jgi:N-acyl-D-amino-acid deacylase
MKILIKNGLIIDGTGSSGFKADLLINNNKIEKIAENIEERDAEIIDASGKVVTPGFIDIHNHGDLTVLKVNKIESYIMQGVTTLVVGMCGLGLAPANQQVKDYYYDYVKKVFNIAPEMFESLQDFHNALEKVGISANLAFFIPQGNVRAYVMGLDEREATNEELEKMKDLVRRDMEAGAFGLSTGLVYPPGSVSSTEELIELSKVVSEFNGIYDSHMRNEGSGVLDIGMKELITIAREADLHGHISHWSVISNKTEKLTPKAIEMVENAREEGLNITADVTVYPDGVTSLAFFLLSPWVYENFKENLTNEETRKRLIKEMFEKVYSIFIADASFLVKLIPKFILRRIMYPILSKQVKIVSLPHNRQVQGMRLFDALKELYPGKKIAQALLDFIRDEEAGIMISLEHKDEEKGIIPLFKRDYVCPSSDGFLVVDMNTHPRSYSAFVRVIERWVKEMEIIELEEAIRKITSLPADTLNLKNRGTLKPGYFADIVVFDLEKLKEKATLENGRQFPDGIEYVIVNGEITVEKGKHNGKLNGVILKHNPKN